MTDALIEKLHDDKAILAAETTRTMEERHPGLFDSYPANGRKRCTEDTVFHIEYLAAALDVGDEVVFNNYVDWLVGLLAARNIPADDVELNFHALADILSDRYPDEAGPAAALLRRPLDRANHDSGR